MRRRDLALVVLIAAAVILRMDPAVQAQVRDTRAGATPRSVGTGVIAGTVVSDDASKRPLRRVAVTVADDGGGTSGRTAITDDAGRFVVAGLAAGRYVITATKAAYLPTAYGSTRPLRPGSVRTGVAVTLAEGQHLPGLTLRMMKSSVLTGTVRDEEGKPARGVTISVMYFARAPQNGARTLTRVPGVDGIMRTDSRGVYRIYGLPPGEYIVSAQPAFFEGSDLVVTTEAELQRAAGRGSSPAAQPRPVRRVGLVPIYYPGTPMVEAAVPITIAANEEKTGIDFGLQFVSNARIDGTVTGLTGAPAAEATVLIYGEGQAQGVEFGRLGAMTDAQGKFSVRGVPPGSYRLAAAHGMDHWGSMPLVVSSEDLQANIRLETAAIVNGTVVAQAGDAAEPPDVARARLRIVADSTPLPLAGGGYPFAVKADGTFRAAIMPGRYRLQVTAPPGWMLKSAMVGKQDVADSLFEVQQGGADTHVALTLTNKIAEVSGRMIDSGGLPAPEYFVILFPADRTLWGWQARRIQQMRPAHDGAFAFRNLPPGDYLIAAVTDVDQNEWFDNNFLASLVESAIKITLAEGDKKTQTIRVK